MARRFLSSETSPRPSRQVWVGLYARVLLPELTVGLTGDAAIAATEGALPTLSVEMLPPVVTVLIREAPKSAT